MATINAEPVCHWCDWRDAMTTRGSAIRASQRHAHNAHPTLRNYAPIEIDGHNPPAQGRMCMVDGCENRAALRQAVCTAHVDARTSGK